MRLQDNENARQCARRFRQRENKDRARLISTVIAVLLALCTTACTKELEITPPSDRHVVLNGEPLAGTRAFVNLAYTHFFLDDNSDQPVPGAAITLVAGDMRYAPDSVSHCNYFFPYTVQQQDSLRVEVSLPDGKRLQAATFVPLVPDIDDFSVTFRRTLIFNILNVQFKLSDHDTAGEIYSIAVNVRDSGMRYNEWKDDFDTIDTVHASYFCLPDNPEITSDDVTPYLPVVAEPYMLYGSRIMFVDRRLAGRKNYEVKMAIPLFRDTAERQPFKHEYTVEVHTFSRERYRYLLSLAQQNGMTSFFAEQGELYTNVDGGLGIYAGGAGRKYTFSIDTIVPERYRSNQNLKKFCQFRK